jgi:hypothetical protein
MNRSIAAARWTLLASVLALTSGCFLLGAGAGAGAGIYFTDRGTSSLVEGSLEDLAERTREVFQEMRIEPTGEEVAEDGGDMELAGKNGPLDITVDLERKGPNSTLVQVSARREGVAWNKEYAKMVLERILAAQ